MTTSAVRWTWALGPLGLSLASSCFYSYDNPVEKAPPASLSGTVELQKAVGGQTPAGGVVAVQWTDGLQVTLNSGGNFLFLDLPDGTYALSVAIPPQGANDNPLLALRPGLVIPNVGKGQVDSA